MGRDEAEDGDEEGEEEGMGCASVYGSLALFRQWAPPHGAQGASFWTGPSPAMLEWVASTWALGAGGES
jgi:hypothetical protein